MRASVTSSLKLDDCRLPETAMLPGAKGLKAALSCLTQARYGIGWGVIGAAMDCYETARSYSVSRASSSTGGRSLRINWCRPSWRT